MRVFRKSAGEGGDIYGFILCADTGMGEAKYEDAKELNVIGDGVYRRAAAGEHYYDYRGGMWACISVLENSIPVAQSIEKATIIPVALLGAGLIFLCGRIWGREMHQR